MASAQPSLASAHGSEEDISAGHSRYLENHWPTLESGIFQFLDLRTKTFLTGTGPRRRGPTTVRPVDYPTLAAQRDLATEKARGRGAAGISCRRGPRTRHDTFQYSRERPALPMIIQNTCLLVSTFLITRSVTPRRSAHAFRS